MKHKFLIPGLWSILVSLVILALPLIRERVLLPEGGYTVATYQPGLLLITYFRMRDWYPFSLMVGFALIVYLGVFVILAFTPNPFRKKQQSS